MMKIRFVCVVVASPPSLSLLYHCYHYSTCKTNDNLITSCVFLFLVLGIVVVSVGYWVKVLGYVFFI